MALLVFFAFAMQCISTLAVVRRETGGWKWPAFQFLYMLALGVLWFLAGFSHHQLLSYDEQHLHERSDSRLRLRREHGRDLYGASQSEASGSRGHEPAASSPLPPKSRTSPDFPKGSGPELVENMKKQAERFGADYLHGARDRSRSFKRPFRSNSRTASGSQTRTLIVASGASARWLGSAERAEADRPRRQFLRHLRRLLLSRQKDHGGRRRRFRHGRSQFPDPLRHEVTLVHRREIPRLENHAGPRPRQSEDQVPAPIPWSKTSTTSSKAS